MLVAIRKGGPIVGLFNVDPGIGEGTPVPSAKRSRTSQTANTHRKWAKNSEDLSVLDPSRCSEGSDVNASVGKFYSGNGNLTQILLDTSSLSVVPVIVKYKTIEVGSLKAVK